VEARVKPEDIDIVREGSEAKVMLSAYKSRFVPRLKGEVIYLSADSFTDEQTGQHYYLARIEIDEEEINSLSADVELYPGMPTESFIKTGESTFLNYLASPIIDSFRRSFKEQ
jgi:HlyD family secretion protein